MRYLTWLAGIGGIAALLLAMGSDDALAQKKDKKADKNAGKTATPADYLQLQNAKDITGTIIGVSGANTISIRLEFPHFEPNPNYKPPANVNPKFGGNQNQQYQQWQRYQSLMRQQEQAMNARNPQEKARAMQRFQTEMMRFQMQQQKEMMQQMAKLEKGQKYPKAGANDPFRIVTDTKDYELEIQDGAPIRKTFLAMEYDDTGNIKQYTEKEKAELRGTDKTKPGYKSKLDEILPGVEAKLYLTSPKKKGKAKDDDEGVGNVERPTVNMIVLTKDNPMPNIAPANPKKKDKK